MLGTGRQSTIFKNPIDLQTDVLAGERSIITALTVHETKDALQQDFRNNALRVVFVRVNLIQRERVARCTPIRPNEVLEPPIRLDEDNQLEGILVKTRSRSVGLVTRKPAVHLMLWGFFGVLATL